MSTLVVQQKILIPDENSSVNKAWLHPWPSAHSPGRWTAKIVNKINARWFARILETNSTSLAWQQRQTGVDERSHRSRHASARPTRTYIRLPTDMTASCTKYMYKVTCSRSSPDEARSHERDTGKDDAADYDARVWRNHTKWTMFVCTKEVNITIAPWVAATTWRWIYPGSKDSIRIRNEPPSFEDEELCCATNTEYNTFVRIQNYPGNNEPTDTIEWYTYYCLAYIHKTPSTDMAGEPRKQVGNEHVPDCTHSCTEDSRERNTSPYKEIGPVIGVDGNNSTAFNMNGSEFSWWTVDCGLWTVVSGGGPIFRGWRILLPGESGVWGCTV